MFPTESEAAFSNYRLWESVGFIIAYAYSAFICTSVKAYILTGVLVLGMTGYFITENNIRKAKVVALTSEVKDDGLSLADGKNSAVNLAYKGDDQHSAEL